MRRPRHVNPDHFLETPQGRAHSEAVGKHAWVLVYGELESLLAQSGSRAVLYVVCGLQGAGKSSWVAQQYDLREPHAIYFDAALPSRRHRQRALALAKSAGARSVGVFIDVPLDVALARNAARPEATRVLDETVLHVHAQLEPPSVAEGFDEIIVVRPTG